jgi:hypothetical protein
VVSPARAAPGRSVFTFGLVLALALVGIGVGVCSTR